MTKEEAIKHLHTYSSTNGSGLTTQEQHEEAKKIAIKALEQPECEDAVSRSHFDKRVRLAGGMSEEELTDDFKDGVLTVLDMLRTEPPVTPKQPGWITCDSGRFPEESGTYTVTAYDGATMRVTYAKYQKRLKRWELTGARAYWRVLAWMPLPEPYKEG